MKAGIICILLALVFSLFVTPQTFADEKASGSSANFAAILQTQRADTRVAALQKYLETNDSPLAPYAATFVEQADINSLPWDLVPAISGTESSLGKDGPCNNFYGFGIYGDQTRCFATVEEGIKTVSEALRQQYIDIWHAKNVDDIGMYYAASPMWATHTKYFMQQIEDFKLTYDAQTLPISL